MHTTNSSGYTVCMLTFCFLACLTPMPIDQTPEDRDGDGVPVLVDCDDNNPDRFPGNSEVCDGADQDCDDAIDEGTLLEGYLDQDGDGVGAGDGLQVCNVLDQGLVYDGNDCDDGDSSTYPGAEELCDEVNNDCDERVDEGVSYKVFYEDSDGDGYGNDDVQLEHCGEPPSGYVGNNQDCDDSERKVNPGVEELCDGLDQD